LVKKDAEIQAQVGARQKGKSFRLVVKNVLIPQKRTVLQKINLKKKSKELPKRPSSHDESPITWLRNKNVWTSPYGGKCTCEGGRGGNGQQKGYRSLPLLDAVDQKQ